MDEKNNTAERPAPKAPESAPVRRVGTLTLGVCLIACGVLFLCYFFVPHFNWDLALKIAPAAGLILLGCEVLYFAARPQRWKYDFLSVFLCIVLMVSAFGGACLMAAFDFALHREEFWIEYDARHQTRKIRTFSRKRRVRIFCFRRRAPPYNKSIRSAWPGCFSSGAVRCGCLFFRPRPLPQRERSHCAQVLVFAKPYQKAAMSSSFGGAGIAKQ